MTDNSVKCRTSKTVGDMYLAAAFLSYGLKLDKVSRDDPRHVRFTFSGDVDVCYVINGDSLCENVKNPSLDMLELKYTSKSLLLPPEYPESVRRIKTIIHVD